MAGRITVNREPAEVGQKVGPGDEVRINGQLVKVRFAEPRPRVLMYHKPAGEIVSRDDPEGRPTVFQNLPNIGNGKWIAIGRLDFNTEGLLLFTNAGELANRLMHPRYEVEREYAVRTLGTLSPEQEKQLVSGIELEDGPAKVESITDGGGEGANHWYHVVLKEGRNREVRRLFEALGLTVSRLIRTRYGSVAMPSRVKRCQTLELSAEEVDAVLAAAGLRHGQQDKPRGKAHGAARPAAPGGRKGKGPRPQQGQVQGVVDPDAIGNRGPAAVAATLVDDGADDAESDGPQPGNSVHGQPTHHNRSVGSLFGKAEQRHGARPAGKRGPRPAAQPGSQGKAFHANRHEHKRAAQPATHRVQGQHSPYVTTTLTIPGAIPQGLPGTNGPKPKGNHPRSGKGGGQPRQPGTGGNGQPRGAKPRAGANGEAGDTGRAHAVPAGKRSRGDRNRRGPGGAPKPAAIEPGNEAPRNVAPAVVDDDFGNR